MLVTCRNGAVLKSKQIIVTLPLGVLKSSGSKIFKAPLPLPLTTAIDRLGFGNFEKIFLQFKNIFWPVDKDTFVNLSGNPFRIWMNIYRPCGNEKGKAYLMTFVTGTIASSLKQLDDVSITLMALSSLREVFGSKVIPEDEEEALLMVEQSLITCWSSDPYTLGAYSHIPIGGLPTDIDMMAKPYYDGMLQFAGEATSRLYPGTVHGALLSGERAALHIAGLH